MAAPGGEPTTRRLIAPLLVLSLLMLGGFALRVYQLDAFSFWTDEGLTPERSGYPIAQILRNEIVIQGVVTKDTHPPLYYLIIHATRRLFGDSDFAFRYPSVLFGVLLIPLLYQLGRRMGGRGLGLIVALLATINPLQVYYSREARMYTLLVLLVTGMSYVLWRALIEEMSLAQKREDVKKGLNARTQGRKDAKTNNPGLAFFTSWRENSLLRWLLLYVLLAGLAFYTHYTVAFLVAAQALFWAWLLWRNGLRRVILAALAVGVLLAVPLVPVTLPRLLGGAEANYFTVSPITMLADVARFFHLGLTVDFREPFVRGLNVLALGLALLGLWAARPWRKRLFLLAWLLAVALGLMAGSYLFKPMYQGVRHIMAGSPAYILLLGMGIWTLWNWLPSGWRDEVRSIRELTGWAAWVAGAPRANPIALVPLVLLLLGAALGLTNLHTNPRYVKDDFRAIVRFIETRAGSNDVIVYNNAVLLPLHEHYRLRPDVAVTALPVYPQVATGQEPEMAALAAEYARVWFITDPPADKRDEGKLIQGWLGANLTEAINRLFPARTTEARVIGYATTADDRPPAAVDGQWLGLPRLTSYRVDRSPLALPTLWVDLFWQGARPAEGVPLLFTLTGPDGRERFRHGHSLLPDDDFRWAENAANRIAYDLPLPPGLPPGTYTLSVAPEGQAPLSLGDVAITSTDTWPVSPEKLFADTIPAEAGGRATGVALPAITWPNGLTLTPALHDDTVLPGNNLPVTLYWRVGLDGISMDNLRYRLEVIGPDGALLRDQEARPGAPWLGEVDGGALLREETGLYIRPDTAPGDYRLRWTLLDGDTPVGEPVTRGRITVAPWPLVTEPPAAQTIVGAEFGPTIQLYGYDLGEAAGGALPITLHWQAAAQPDRDYSVFVHLVDADGNIISQSDGVPLGGARPTTGWRPGEFISDAYNLTIPADLPPGSYDLFVGLYDPDDGTRPPVILQGERQPNDQLRLRPLLAPEDLP